jgi:nicotinate dehydrogenase subunit A
MSSDLVIQVNGKRHSVSAPPATPLLYILRNQLGLHGPRFGCGLAQCGACSALLGDQSIRTCVTPVGGVVGRPVTTLEGLGTPEKPHPLQTAFIREQAAQCGFCTNGMIMAAASFLRLGALHANSSEAEIRSAMEPWLCRCGTHFRIVAAIKSAAKTMKA